MPEDTLTLRADPTNSFDVLQRLGGATDRLGQSGERMGAGFIRGDRAVRVATQNITQSLLSANNAADATLATFAALERVFKIPLAGTIGAAAGIAGAAALRAEFKKTQDAVDALRQNLRVPISIEVALSPEDIASRVDELRKTTEALEKRSGSFGEKVARFFAPAASGGMSSGRIREAEQTKLIAEGEREILELERARADKLLQIAGLKLVEDDLAKAELTLEQKRAALVEESVAKGGNTLNLYKRLLAAQIDLEVAARKKAESDAKTLDKAKATTAELEKQATALNKQQTAGEAASERRKERSRKSEEQSLKDQLSREGDPEKRADIKDRLAEIQQQREDEAKKKQEQEMARQEAERQAEAARQEQQRIQAQQQEEKRAADQKKSDQSEVQRFGRVLSPEERLNQRLQDEGDARQKKFQDDENARQQGFRDRAEAEARGITPEQLKNERDFNKKSGKADVSSTMDVLNESASAVSTTFDHLAAMDFSGLAPLNGLTIQIV